MKVIYQKNSLVVSDNEAGGVVFVGSSLLSERDVSELTEALRKWIAHSSVAGHFARRPGMMPESSGE
jgi:hypothetical protein